jgi:hypothetical protein
MPAQPVMPRPTPGGFTVPGGARPPAAAPPRRGTVIKEEAKRPGTVLYSQKRDLPVCGWLVVLRGRRQGRDFRIEKDSSVLGRDGHCDYPIEDDTVSREHCRIRRDGDSFKIHDLGSGNGTYLNGERVYHADLTDGDILKVGESLILFKEAKARIPIAQADVPIAQADVPIAQADAPIAQADVPIAQADVPIERGEPEREE